MRFTLLTCCWLLTFSLSAQTNILVGGPAPEINITGWLANVPEDQQLKGKYVVLEFWATWCGPCLAAVPHLNQLQRKYEDYDVQFVAITDEQAARTDHIIEKLDFQSTVVTDTTKQTQIAYGDGEKGLTAIPLTVLIDRNQIVRWIGQPEQLTEKVMDNFLADEPIGWGANMDPERDTDELDAFEHGTDYFLSLFREAGMVWHLDITEREGGEAPSSMQMGDMGYFNEGVLLSDFFLDLLPDKEVILPPSLAATAYTVYYINKTGDPYSWETLVRAISDELDLEVALEKGQTPAYELFVADSSLLKPVDGKFSSTSDMDDGRVVITNYTLAGLGEELRDYSDFSWSYAGDDDKSYAFILDTSSEESILQSLATYGISAQKQMQEVEIIRFTER